MAFLEAVNGVKVMGKPLVSRSKRISENLDFRVSDVPEVPGSLEIMRNRAALEFHRISGGRKPHFLAPGCQHLLRTGAGETRQPVPKDTLITKKILSTQG